MSLDAVELTKKLLSYNTINPPGNEQAVMESLGEMLTGAGFVVELLDYAPGRKHLLARLQSSGKSPAIAFTGHLDTVPLGEAPWSVDPFAGEIAGDRLYGRGSSDMKGGVGALVVAALSAAQYPRSSDIILVLTADEETGCSGARRLVASTPPPLLPTSGVKLLVVGEPTGNVPMFGHKGALWLRGSCQGKSAHGSMPELGENAIYKAAQAVGALAAYKFKGKPHPLLGSPTLNIGTFTGGRNINSVPDRAQFTVDLRSVPGQSHSELRTVLAECVGDDVEWESELDVEGVMSDPNNIELQRVSAIVTAVTGKAVGPRVETATYFTDASALVPAMGGVPAVILGPGELSQAHVTDEWCSIRALEQATEIYQRILNE